MAQQMKFSGFCLFENVMMDDFPLCVYAGEHLVSEESIHMVPFQFDLIKLLPKCQQVELFFVTFSTGMYGTFYFNLRNTK